MAKYETYEDKRKLAVETEVWAYMYSDNNIKECLNQKPIKGSIGHDSLIGNFFAPFKEGTTVRDLDKVVRLDLRNYADTEKEAIEGYNKLIENVVEYHIHEIIRVAKQVIV